MLILRLLGYHSNLHFTVSFPTISSRRPLLRAQGVLDAHATLWTQRHRKRRQAQRAGVEAHAWRYRVRGMQTVCFSLPISLTKSPNQRDTLVPL